ncbi:MAG: tetratricopeptide repeat protein [Acidobacteriota bacterium]
MSYSKIVTPAQNPPTVRLLLLCGLLATAPAPEPVLATPGEGGPPLPDLQRVEPPVRKKIESRQSEVVARPESAEAWGRLGMALDIHDFEASAESAYARALALDPDHFPWAYYRALTLTEISDPRAADAFDRALELNPNFSPLLIRYGDFLLDAGDADGARLHYSRGLEADGDGLTYAFFGLARLALADGDLEAAAAHAEQATALDPSNRDAWGLLAELHRRRGQDRRAAEARQAYAAIRGPAVLADVFMAELMEEGVSSFWHHKRGQFFLASRLDERAEAEFRRAIELSPHAIFFESLARALLIQERSDEAEEAVRRALEVAPDLASSHLFLGRLLVRAGRPEEGLASLRRAAELRPDTAAAQEFGRQLVAAGERVEGMRWLERSLEVEEEPQVLLGVAFFYATTPDAELRDGEKSERMARRLLEITGERPEIFDVLGAAFAAQGRFDEAIQAAERAERLARGRGSPMVLQMRRRLELYRAGQPFIASR